MGIYLEEKEEKIYQVFMKELEKISKKYGIAFEGCGVFAFCDEKVKITSSRIVQCMKQINTWKLFIYSQKEFTIGNFEQYIRENEADYLFIQNFWQSKTINVESLKKLAI